MKVLNSALQAEFPHLNVRFPTAIRKNHRTDTGRHLQKTERQRGRRHQQLTAFFGGAVVKVVDHHTQVFARIHKDLSA